MATILDKIIDTKKLEIDEARRRVSERELEDQIHEAPAPLDFRGELAATSEVRLIAEVKKASPSAGIIREDFDPVEIAKTYERAGAACISVLTDQEYFQGSLDYLRRIRREVARPLLRKDFIIDRYQLLEARAAGADCVLLIAECLSPTQMKELHQEACSIGMQTLIELYEADNLQAVLATGGKLIGINNRNLKSFQTDLNHSVKMCAEIPNDCLVVGESGIRTYEDVQLLATAGVKAILVGESLMRQTDIEHAVKSLLNHV